MPVTQVKLSDVSDKAISQKVSNIIARLSEMHPEMDLGRGVLRDLLVRPHAVLSASDEATLRKYLDARSLLQIEVNPELVDEDILDDVMSNFRILRRQGSRATGSVVLVVSNNTTVTIPSGLGFDLNGVKFLSNQTFSARYLESQVNSSGDVLLRELSDGTFAFTIQVTAEEVGSSGLARKDDLVTPDSPPKNYITSYASGDFTGGIDTETNMEVLSRMQEGVASRTTSNRVTTSAMVRGMDGFEGIKAMSIVGMSDSEMTRDQHSIIPVSSGGVVDLYIRSAGGMIRSDIEVYAKCQSIGVDQSQWSFAFNRDVCGGCYEVRGVRPFGSSNTLGGFTIESIDWGYDLAPGIGPFSGISAPDIQSVEESSFTGYQTAVVSFLDSESSTSGMTLGETRKYDVTVVSAPLVTELQSAISQRSSRSLSADTLVRGAIPCIVSLDFTISHQSSSEEIDINGMKQSLSDKVNATPFIGRLYSSSLHDIVQGFLKNNDSPERISMFGRVIGPDRKTYYLSDTSVLDVNDVDHSQITSRTVQFFLDPGDISISTKSVTTES